MAAKTPTAPLAAPAADPAATPAAAPAAVPAPAVLGVAAADAAADALITTGQEINGDNNGQIPSPEAGIDGSAPADGVDPSLAAAADMAAARLAEAKSRKVRTTTTEEYEEIAADDEENIKRKDEAVCAGKRVMKVGTGTGAVFRIYK